MDGMASPHLLLAADAIERGNGHKALEHLEMVTDLDTPEPWLVRAQAFVLTDQPAAARDAANRGLEIEPTNASLLLALSRAESASNQPARAEQALLAILNREPEHQLALLHYAQLLTTSGDPAGASDIVARLDPQLQTTAPVLTLRARIASALGHEKEAADLTKLALHIDPDSTSAHAVRAMQASLRDQPTEYVDSGRRAASLDPENMASLGRSANYLDHPLMAPSRWIERLGPGKLWIGWIALMFVGRQVLPAPIITALTFAYLGLVIYSWTVPFLFRKWLTMRGRL